MNPPIALSADVTAAQQQGVPVVALESTIITHGMPYPANQDTALQVEQVIRSHGAVPATIAVIDGMLQVGLDEAQLNALAQASDVMKLSRADLAFAVAQKRTGSTTVAATMLAAHLAGISVFATGGIGGVHRGAESSFDISADLHELAKTAVHVVSAGPKAILDIPKTLEVLETLGVPVVALGQANLPAFWSSDSGIPAPLHLPDVAAIASFIKAREQLQVGGGVLIGNPVPQHAEIARDEMEQTIQVAIGECEAAGIVGKATTPWLLQRVVELTDGRSLATNQQLILNNAAVAAQLAVQLRKA